jgi:hypothetical protein
MLVKSKNYILDKKANKTILLSNPYFYCVIKRTVITSTTTTQERPNSPEAVKPVELDNKDLNKLIDENARNLANIQEQLNKSNPSAPQSNVEGISAVSTGSLSSNIPDVNESSSNPLAQQTTSNLDSKMSSMETNSSTNESQSASPINDIKSVSMEPIADEKLDAITESTHKLRISFSETEQLFKEQRKPHVD